MAGKGNDKHKSNNRIMKVIIWIGVVFLCALIQNAIKKHGGIINVNPSSDASAFLVASLSGVGVALLYAVGFTSAFFLCRLWDKHHSGNDNNRTNADGSGLELSETLADADNSQTAKTIEFKQNNRQIEMESADSSKYGLAANFPVFVNGKGNKNRYLDCLCAKEGEALSFRYKKSILTKSISGFVEQYNAYRMDGSLYGTIFVSVYGTKDAAKAPEGYKLSARYDKNSDSKAVLKHSVSANETENKKKVAFEDITISNLSESDSNNDWIAIMDVYAPHTTGNYQEDLTFCRDLYMEVYQEKHSKRGPLYTSTDTIKKNLHAKYPEKSSELLDKLIDKSIAIMYLREPNLKARDQMNNLAFEIMSNNTEKNKELEGRDTSDPEYGLVPEKPIFVQGFGKDRAYLDRLCTEDGESLTHHRLGSMKIMSVNGPVDEYEMQRKDGSFYGNIYLSVYGNSTPIAAPKGYRMLSEDKEDDDHHIEDQQYNNDALSSEEHASTTNDAAQTKDENQQKRAANTKKRLTVLSVTLLLVVILTITTIFYFIPQIRYTSAKNSLENQDFDNAIAVFTDLGTFKDSTEMVKETNYQRAVVLMNNQQYVEAISIFNGLKRYKDSQTKLSVCKTEDIFLQAQSDFDNKKYLDAARRFSSIKTGKKEAGECAKKAYYYLAKEFFDKGDYTTAALYYKDASDYSDATEMIQESYYQFGWKRFEDKDYARAYEYLTKVKNYKDVPEKYDEISYQYGSYLLTKEKWDDAMDIFESLKDYSGSQEKVQEAKYGYVINNKSRDDDKTYHFLTTLKETGYKESAAIYKELFGWSATIVFSEKDDMTVFDYMKLEIEASIADASISKYNGGYAHIHISGGPPDGEIPIKFTASLPDGQTVKNEFEGTSGSGDYLSWNFTFTDPTNWPTGTLSMKIYDKSTGELIGEGKCNIVK